MSKENRKKMEAFPIDRTPGIFVPAREQMTFDEMQNAPKSLWDAAMTRAEEFGKVVLCGDTNKIDATNIKGLEWGDSLRHGVETEQERNSTNAKQKSPGCMNK